jgi:hypothetical protein
MLPLGAVFWILMLLWLVFGSYWWWPSPGPMGINLLLFFIIAILGWHAFGPPFHG